MAKEPNNKGRRDEAAPEFADRLVAINRVSKSVKGGKRFGCLLYTSPSPRD